MVSNPDLLFKTLKMGELLVKEDLLKAAIWVPVEVKVLKTPKLRFDENSKLSFQSSPYTKRLYVLVFKYDNS